MGFSVGSGSCFYVFFFRRGDALGEGEEGCAKDDDDSGVGGQGAEEVYGVYVSCFLIIWGFGFDFWVVFMEFLTSVLGGFVCYFSPPAP